MLPGMCTGEDRTANINLASRIEYSQSVLSSPDAFIIFHLPNVPASEYNTRHVGSPRIPRHLGYNDCPSAAKENITQLASVSFHGAHVQTGCECSKYVSPPPPLLSITAFGARTPRRANIRP